MSHMLDRIFQRMGEIIHRVDAPRAASIVMVRVQDAVEHRIAHVHVRGCKPDFCPQHRLAFLKFSTPHCSEFFEIFIHAALAES